MRCSSPRPASRRIQVPHPTAEQTSATAAERRLEYSDGTTVPRCATATSSVSMSARAWSATCGRPDAALTDNDTSRFDIARRRIGVEGEIADVADFQIEREFADRRPWRDVYVNYRGLDRVELQAGQFKLPFGLDENTSSTNLDFVYRSRAARLSPGRDPGLMAHGRVGVVRYEAGAIHSGRRQRPRRRRAAAVRRLDHRGPAARAAASFVHVRVRRPSGRHRLHLERRPERHRGSSRAQRAARAVLPAGVCGAGHAAAGRPRDAMAPRSLLGAIRAGSDDQRAPRAEHRRSGSAVARGLRLVRARDLGRHRREEDRRRGRTETAAVRRRVWLAGVCGARRGRSFFQRRRGTTVNRSASGDNPAASRAAPSRSVSTGRRIDGSVFRET